MIRTINPFHPTGDIQKILCQNGYGSSAVISGIIFVELLHVDAFRCVNVFNEIGFGKYIHPIMHNAVGIWDKTVPTNNPVGFILFEIIPMTISSTTGPCSALKMVSKS